MRALLPLQDGFPKAEFHQFRRAGLLASYYPISSDRNRSGKCIWSLIVPVSSAVGAGDADNDEDAISAGGAISVSDAGIKLADTRGASSHQANADVVPENLNAGQSAHQARQG